ncbi:MAG: lysophospholipid acyltransferase family protein [Burkholderiaceae bacterium]
MASNGIGRAMFDRVERFCRIFTTGLSFVLFGFGGLVLRIIVFPFLNIFIWERQMRINLARHVIRLSFRGFIGFMRMLGVLRYEITGLERLDRNGLLILANHPTLLDTVFLMAFVKQADCVVKGKLWDNPFTHGPVCAAGYINNESSTGLVEDCINSLRKGGNLIIFPEGTRTPHHGQITLKRGAANIAVRGNCDVTPIAIQCFPPTLRKGDKWWHVPHRRMHFTITVHDDIKVDSFIEESGSAVLAARHLTDYLQNYFIKENQRHAVA